MARKSHLPRISSVDFYRFTEDEFIFSLAERFSDARESEEIRKLSSHQAAIVCWSRLLVEVFNGGFTQFFYNNRGDAGVAGTASLLEDLKETKAATILRDATAIYKANKAKFKTENPWDGLFGEIPEFDKLERAFVNQALKCTRALEKWIRANIAELAIDQNANAIDPNFTGAVETKQTNGLSAEYLEVKKGKPSGAYRLFFEDGSVHKVIFYKAGKISGDFWPNGQLKKKEAKQGKHTVIEWYYPSGKLHKRYVHDKDGYATEPIRLYHENGQLAEELNTSKGDKRGKWLKFFDDGSPKLIAEYRAGEKLVIHDAWNDERKQVVKDGSGKFYDDAKSIDWKYEVYWNGDWQSEVELKEGVPHGKSTTYHDHVLWSVGEIKNGVADGESIMYWDNGRVRTKSKIAKGKTIKSQEFPKFDNPQPAVVLSIRADERLYSAWGHTPVDEYPQVLNQAKVERQFKLPQFLKDVDARNRAREVEDDYEDWNSFNDGIAYFLTVNEAGEVTNAVANGSGVYSSGEWGTYPPLLMRLRFKPGRIRGKAIECRVLANVDHTFVDGANS